MGNHNTKLTPEDLDQLCKITNFDRKEIEKMFKDAMKGNETGLINGEQFVEFMKTLGVHEDFISQLLFGVFDRDADGLVDFKELMVTLSIGAHGTPEDKIKLMFRVYDINEDGHILKNEMMKIFTSIFRMKKEVKKAKHPLLCLDTHGWEDAESAVEEIFKKMDVNKDEKITYEEFRDACLADAAFLDMMNFFKTQTKE